MIREMSDKICCPDCKVPMELKVAAENDQEILTGTLLCRKCAVSFPIDNGIPILLPAGLRKVSPK